MVLLAAGFDWSAATVGGAVAALFLLGVLTLSDLARFLVVRHRLQEFDLQGLDERFLGYTGKGTPKPRR